MNKLALKSSLVFLVCFFCLAGTLLLANPVKERFLKVLAEDGLSNSTINSMVMDKDGFLWIATQDGLNKYDGYTIEQFNYDDEDSTGLADRGIMQLLKDHQDNIWLLTKGAYLQKINQRDHTFKTYFNGFVNDEKIALKKIIEESPGRFWMISNRKGIFTFDVSSQSISKLSIDSGFDFNEISAHFKSKDQIWIANKTGQVAIYDINSKLFTNIDLSRYIEEGRKGISSIFKNENHIFIGTISGGVLVFDQNFELIHEMRRGKGAYDLTSDIISIIEKDHQNRVWIASAIRGINIVDPETFMVKQIIEEPTPYSISGEGIRSLYRDPLDNIWIGTYINGFNLWLGKDQKIIHINLKQDWKGQNAPAVVEDSEGNIWVANGGDLSKISPDYNQVTDYARVTGDPLNIRNKKVRYLAIDSRDNLIVGTRYHGVFIKYKNNQTKLIYEDNTSSINNIQVDNEDNILIATSKGLVVYHPSSEKIDIYNKNQKAKLNIGQDEVNFAFVDENNYYWLAFNNNKILQINPLNNTYTAYPLAFEQNEDINISCLLVHQETLWAGSTNAGLFRFNRNTGKTYHYNTDSGLPGNKIKSIEKDDKGKLWVSTDNGIFSLDPVSDKIDQFSIPDGLQGLNFITHSSFYGKSGKLYFGGYRGLNVFHPDSVEKNNYIPPVRLTQVMIQDNKAQTSFLNTGDSTIPELTYNQKNITFSFSSFNYNRSSNIIYAYRLAGLDNTWNTVSHQENINYRNLPPGSYTFQVKSMLQGEDFESIPASISFRIKNSPWKTPWAFASYFLIIGGFLFLSRKITLDRVKLKNHLRLKEVEAEKIKEIDKLKNEFYTNLSHELKTPLTLIISPLKRMFDENDFLLDQKKINELKMMLDNAERLQKLINQIIDLSKIQEKGMVLGYHYDNIIPLVKGLVENFSFKAAEQNIQLTYHSYYQDSWCYFDKDVLEKVVFNLLSNSLKHTPEGGKIDIRLFIARGHTNSPQYVSIIVSDNGEGMEQSILEKIFVRYFHQEISQNWNKSDGIGLSLVKKLIEIHRGTIKVKSKINNGTTVIFSIPVHTNTLAHAGVMTSPGEVKLSKDEDYPLQNEEKPLILIAEDDNDLLEYLVENLKNSYHLVAVNNGEAAHQQALEKIPDLIISDMMMPGMTGITLLDKIKNNSLTNHIPFIMLTGKTSTSAQIDTLQMGADDYISKPFNFLLLRSRIVSLLKNREQLRKKFQENQVVNYKLKDDNYSQFMRSFNNLLEKHYQDHNFGIEQIEQSLNMSHVQLYRKLKAVTNSSANTLLRNYRLQKAKKLLTEGNFNISQVAYEVGFNDPAYFTRCFSKMEGVSPKEFIERHLTS